MWIHPVFIYFHFRIQKLALESETNTALFELWVGFVDAIVKFRNISFEEFSHSFKRVLSKAKIFRVIETEV
jgi:hypothetical protein